MPRDLYLYNNLLASS